MAEAVSKTVIDAKDMIVGRVASSAAKAALEGQDVAIVNCDEAIISGRRRFILEDYRAKMARGTTRWGPFYSRLPDRFVRRMIRGMLPYKNPRGKEAYKRIMCYKGVPEEYESSEKIVVAKANMSKLATTNFIKVGELCTIIGGKK